VLQSLVLLECRCLAVKVNGFNIPGFRSGHNRSNDLSPIHTCVRNDRRWPRSMPRGEFNLDTLSNKRTMLWLRDWSPLPCSNLSPSSYLKWIIWTFSNACTVISHRNGNQRSNIFNDCRQPTVQRHGLSHSGWNLLTIPKVGQYETGYNNLIFTVRQFDRPLPPGFLGAGEYSSYR
jgi:hypothetical protein